MRTVTFRRLRAVCRALRGLRLRRGAVSDFLILVSGANRAVLAEAPGDRVKQATLGGVILMTAGLAAASSGFALRMALHAPWVVVFVLAGLWALAIANLDRWLVTSTARQSAWWRNVVLAVPRLLLAVVIGVVVSTPMTLQIFHAEIDDELTNMQAAKQAQFERRMDADPRYAGLPGMRAEVARLEQAAAAGVPDEKVFASPEVADLRARLAAVDARLAPAQEAVVCEQEGKCGSGKAGSGPAYAEKVKLRDRLQKERDTLAAALSAKTAEVRTDLQRAARDSRAAQAPRLAELQRRVAATQHARDLEVAAKHMAVLHGDGLLARLEALDRLSAENSAMGAAHRLLFLFFLAIECLPVLFKLLLFSAKPTLYEELTLLGEESVLARKRLHLTAAHDREVMDTRVTLEAREARLRGKLEAEMAIAEALLADQTKLARKITAQWRRDQQARMESDLDGFLNAGAPFAPDPADTVQDGPVQDDPPEAEAAWSREPYGYDTADHRVSDGDPSVTGGGHR